MLKLSARLCSIINRLLALSLSALACPMYINAIVTIISNSININKYGFECTALFIKRPVSLQTILTPWPIIEKPSLYMLDVNRIFSIILQNKEIFSLFPLFSQFYLWIFQKVQSFCIAPTCCLVKGFSIVIVDELVPSCHAPLYSAGLLF